MIEIEKPRIDCEQLAEDGSYGKFVVEPLERGYGTTLGNSLRRILLSSLPGTAASSIKIAGVQHEFSTIPGVKEDVTEIVLNVKGIIAKLHCDGPKTVYIEAAGEGEVKAGDIHADGEVEILNPDLHIATLMSDARLSMEITMTSGRGYVPAEKNKQHQTSIGVIPVDSIYTPVYKVNYTVENTRVRDLTDYDKLTLEIWTDGTITARDAVSLGAKVLRDHLDLFVDLSEEIGLVTYGYSLYVDGEMIGATPYEGALEELLHQLQTRVSNENTISCGFQEDVTVKPGYVPTEKIMNLGYLAETLYSTKTEEVTYTVKSGDTWSEIANSHGMTSKELLEKNPGYNINRISIGEVLTMSAAVPYLTLTVTQRESYLTDIPYDVEYTDDSSIYKGDYKVLSAGQYGKADVTANVTYVNGEETERTVLSYVTLREPVTEQQARGTKERPTWLPTGSFRWPCSGSITSRFGYRSSIFGSSYHGGLDIANRYGTPIYAADGGTVIYAGWMSSYGYLVQIDHGNGYVTYYGHNSRLLVSVGQKVYKGQQIAKMGSTGNSTGNHCHFEVRYNGVRKNPLNYL